MALILSSIVLCLAGFGNLPGDMVGCFYPVLSSALVRLERIICVDHSFHDVNSFSLKIIQSSTLLIQIFFPFVLLLMAFFFLVVRVRTH